MHFLLKIEVHKMVSVRSEFQYIMNFDEFAQKAKKIDYIYVVDSLVSRLYGYEKEGKFAPLVIDLIANHTDIDNEEEEE